MAAEKFHDLFAFDLDGTLVHRRDDGERDIPKPLLDLVFKLSERANVIVATGRRYKAALVDIEKLPVMPFHIVHNGLVIKDSSQKTVMSGGMAVEKALEIALLLSDEGHDAFFVSDGHEYGTDYTFTETALHHSEAVRAISMRPRQNGRLLKKLENILDHRDVPILEVATLGDFERLQKLQERLETRLPSQFRSVIVRNIGHSKLAAMEIFERSYSKGSAVDFVKLKLGASRVISVGDDGNDIEMIKSADIGIVMDHAEPYIKDLSPVHVKGAEGLAMYLKEYLSK